MTKKEIYIFKVKDYTTIMVGRMTDDANKYYVERGDGTRYEYWADEVERSQLLQSKDDYLSQKVDKEGEPLEEP